MRLTDTAIKALKPREHVYDVHDDDVKCFGFRVTPAGVKSFTFFYRLGDRRKKKISPDAACVHFALSPPDVASVALDTSRTARVGKNVTLAAVDEVPGGFWREIKDLPVRTPTSNEVREAQDGAVRMRSLTIDVHQDFGLEPRR